MVQSLEHIRERETAPKPLERHGRQPLPRHRARSSGQALGGSQSPDSVGRGNVNDAFENNLGQFGPGKTAQAEFRSPVHPRESRR